ncbi:hypothetical protein FEP69_05029 [Burkholderia multivorans]|nr:hypothetical protein [Burkholderia multivorans]
MSCAKPPFFAPRFSARIAFADSEPKLIAEMLKIEMSYGCARVAPTRIRKSWFGSRVGASEWLIHSCATALTLSSVP